MTSITNSCGATNYTWDVRNRLVGINGFKPDCSALSASFKYDALGRRIEKTVNGRTIQYLYDGLDIVQEIENGVVTANYVRTLNIDEPLARIKSDGTVRYYQTDALGSIVALTNETGTVRTTYSYDPFGAVTISGETSDNPFQYTGRENDGTGLYYYRARYYSPELQRFVSEDPVLKYGNPNTPFLLPALLIAPQALNSYLYVANNPVNFTDPLGLLKCADYKFLCKRVCFTICMAATGGDPLAIPLCMVSCHVACESAYKNCKDPDDPGNFCK
jgi:RHS repeat-associated protein